MRSRILGLIGVVWGAGILLSRLLRGPPQGGGAYPSGQVAGLIFGGILLVAGLLYLFRGSGVAARRRSPSAGPPGGGAGVSPRPQGPRAQSEPTLRWREPMGYRLRLRGDLGLRLLTACGGWALATGVLCGLFAINVQPPGLGLAVCLGAVFGLGPATLLLFLRKPHVSGRIRADEAGLHRVRFYASLTEMWSEETVWPYEALSEAVITPGAALGQSFSLLLLGTGEEAEIIALPQRLERDALVRLLASKGVSVRVAPDVPAVWRRRLAPPVAGMVAAVGLAVLVGGAGFYRVRVSGRHTAASRPALTEVPRSAAGTALVGATPATGGEAMRQVAAGTPSAGGRSAAPPTPPVPGPAVPGAPMLRPDAGRGSAVGLAHPVPGTGTGDTGPRVDPRPPLPGAVAAAGQPGDSELVGGPGGFPFRLAAGAAKPVLGFRYGLGSWAGQPALSLFEPLYGPQPASQNVVMARDGYAVGALKVAPTTLVGAVQVVFMRLLPDGRLDPRDSYTAAWIGRPSDLPAKVLGGSSQPVIGVHGRRGAVIDAIGLVRAPGP